MPIKFKCPHCSTVLNVPDAVAGKTGKCKGCGEKIVVPASSEAASAPLPAEAPPAKPSSSATSRPSPPRTSTNAPGPVTPPKRTRPMNPAPPSAPTSSPASAPLDSYGALFDRVDAAAGGSDEGVLNAEVIDDTPANWDSSAFAIQAGGRGAVSQPAQGGPFVSNAGVSHREQRKNQFQQFWALGAVALFGMLFSAALFAVGPEHPPVPVDMAALEAGRQPKEEYVEIGPHIACYYAGVCTMKKRDEKKADPPIEKFSYPIISATHPAAAELLALAQAHGGFDNLPEDVFPPPLEHVSAIVVTEEFSRTSEVPLAPVRIERLTGTQSLSFPHDSELEESCETDRGGLRGAIGIKANNKPLFRSAWTIGGGLLCSGVSLMLLGLSLTAGFRWITKAKPAR